MSSIDSDQLWSSSLYQFVNFLTIATATFLSSITALRTTAPSLISLLFLPIYYTSSALPPVLTKAHLSYHAPMWSTHKWTDLTKSKMLDMHWLTQHIMVIVWAKACSYHSYISIYCLYLPGKKNWVHCLTLGGAVLGVSRSDRKDDFFSRHCSRHPKRGGIDIGWMGFQCDIKSYPNS